MCNARPGLLEHVCLVLSVHSAVKLGTPCQKLVWAAILRCACKPLCLPVKPPSETPAAHMHRHIFESLQQDVIAERDNAAASWEQLPRDVQHHVLAMSGMPCVRRVSKAARDAFDAINDT